MVDGEGFDTGWEQRRHPALEKIGGDDRAYDPIVTVETIETLLTQSSRLEDEGCTFTALRNHERADEYEGVADGAFVLSVPAVPDSIAETAQEELGRTDGDVVTFLPSMAEEYPSIRLVLRAIRSLAC